MRSEQTPAFDEPRAHITTQRVAELTRAQSGPHGGTLIHTPFLRDLAADMIDARERIEALTAERDAATAQREALAAGVREYLDAEHSYADCRGVLSDVWRTLTALNAALAGCP